MNRKSGLSNSLLSIAMAGVEVERPSRKKGRLAFLAMEVTESHTADAMITVSTCSDFEFCKYP